MHRETFPCFEEYGYADLRGLQAIGDTPLPYASIVLFHIICLMGNQQTVGSQVKSTHG